MDSNIEVWRVQQFAANVLHLSQQEGSRLAQYCRQETFTGKVEFFDRLGLAVAQDKTGRNQDTPNLDITHSRRMVSTVTREWGTLVDRKDKVQNIHDPENEYSKAAQAAIGRKMDAVAIAAANGTAYTGEDGTTSTSLGNAQKVAAVASNALDYANVQQLRKAKYIMDSGEVMGNRYLAHAAGYLERLLAQTEVTSSDFNTVRALVAGNVDSFLGFKFIHTELVGSNALATTYDADTFLFSVTTGLYSGGGTAVGATDLTALAFAEGGLLMGMNPNVVARIDERADKGYSMQVYAARDIGAVRMEEARVVQLIYKA